MIYKINETINYYRVDIDQPEVINKLADHIDASCGFEATQTVVYRNIKQGFIICRANFVVTPENREHTKNKLGEIVEKFLAQ